MARTKATEQLATTKKKSVSKHSATSVEPVHTKKKREFKKWRAFTSRRRELIKLQNQTSKSFLQYSTGAAVIKQLMSELEEERYTRPLPGVSQTKKQTIAHYSTSEFKRGAIDVLQHTMVDLTRAAMRFQLHRNRATRDSPTAGKKAVKLLVSDIEAAGLLVDQRIYHPDIFNVINPDTPSAILSNV